MVDFADHDVAAAVGGGTGAAGAVAEVDIDSCENLGNGETMMHRSFCHGWCGGRIRRERGEGKMDLKKKLTVGLERAVSDPGEKGGEVVAFGYINILDGVAA